MHARYSLNAWEIREANESLITHIPGGKTDDDAKAIAELIASAPALLADNAKLREALQGVLGLIDSGYLVRDTDNDGKPDFAIRQLEPMRVLSKAAYAVQWEGGAQAVKTGVERSAK